MRDVYENFENEVKETEKNRLLRLEDEKNAELMEQSMYEYEEQQSLLNEKDIIKENIEITIPENVKQEYDRCESIISNCNLRLQQNPKMLILKKRLQKIMKGGVEEELLKETFKIDKELNIEIEKYAEEIRKDKQRKIEYNKSLKKNDNDIKEEKTLFEGEKAYQKCKKIIEESPSRLMCGEKFNNLNFNLDKLRRDKNILPEEKVKKFADFEKYENEQINEYYQDEKKHRERLNDFVNSKSATKDLNQQQMEKNTSDYKESNKITPEIQSAYEEGMNKIRDAIKDLPYIQNLMLKLKLALKKNSPEEILEEIKDTKNILDSQIEKYNNEKQQQERKINKFKDRKRFKEGSYNTDDVDPKYRSTTIPNISSNNKQDKSKLQIDAMVKYFGNTNPEFPIENIYEIKDEKILESIITENNTKEKLFLIEEYDEELNQQLYTFYSLDENNKLRQYYNELLERKTNDLTLDRQPGLFMANRPGFKVGAHGKDVSNIMTIDNDENCITIYKNEKGVLGLGIGDKGSNDITNCEINKVYDRIENGFNKEKDKNHFLNNLKGLINDKPVYRESTNKELDVNHITR